MLLVSVRSFFEYYNLTKTGLSVIIFLNIRVLAFLLIIFAATAVGFFAGLFGIGGGLISVPCLFLFFETLNFDKDYLMHLTVGTALILYLLLLCPYDLHNKNKLVDFSVVKTFGLFVVLGVLAGTVFTSFMKTNISLILFSSSLFFWGISNDGPRAK